MFSIRSGVKQRRAFLAGPLLSAIGAVLLVFAGCGGGGGGGGSNTVPPASTYTVTYNGNGATSGTVPVDGATYAAGASVTILGNTGGLALGGYNFSGWNTKANGSGTACAVGGTCVMGSADMVLYAQWVARGGGLTISYDGNGASGGSVPIDTTSYGQGQTVTVLGNSGNLVFSGYTFEGWQTKADGSGTTYAAGQTFPMGAASQTLYAMWAGGYAYSANNQNGAGGSVSQYWIGPNGALTPMFTPLVTSGGLADPRYVAVDPSGSYLYVSSMEGTSSITGCPYGCGNVAQYAIGADGSLTSMSTPTAPSGVYPAGGSVHPSGKWFYVGDANGGQISQYTIATGGALTPMSPAAVTAGVPGAGPSSVSVDPSGKYLYAAMGFTLGSNNILQYNIDQTTGVLTAMSPASVASGGTYPWEIKFGTIPSGTFAYAVDYGTGQNSTASISTLAVNPTNGTLTLVDVVTAGPNGQYAFGLVVHPNGKFAYAGVCCASPSTVLAEFQIDQTTGKLTSTGVVAAGGAAVASLAIESSGKYLYATSGGTGYGVSSIAQYTIDPTTGALTPMSTPTVQSGTYPSQIVTVGK